MPQPSHLEETIEQNKFQCHHCKNVYENEWTDEEAKAEATEIFGKPPDEWNDEKVVVCDTCFQEMNPMNNLELLEKAKKML
jgi:rubredoxin